MEPLKQGEDGACVSSAMESWHQLPAEMDPSQFLEEISALPESVCQHSVALCSERHLSGIEDSRTQPVTNKFESLQLEFQESHLSPALTLIPQEKTLVFSESTLLHHTDSEFAPLRGFPDLSIASGRCPRISHLDVDIESEIQNMSHEEASLSQHPLGVTAYVSEGGSSCCSLSQHSLSPSSHYLTTHVQNEEQVSGPNNSGDRQMEGEEQTNVDLGTGETAVCGIIGSAPAPSLLEDVCVANSSAVSSASGTALSQTEVVLIQPHSSLNQSKLSNIGHYQAYSHTAEKEPKSIPSGSREQPQGDSSSLSSQRKTTEKVDVSLSSHISTISNITFRSSSMLSDHTTEKRQHLSHSQSDPIVSAQGIQSGTKDKDIFSPSCGVGVYEVGLQGALGHSGSQTTADGSFLTSKPVSQSTPAVLFSRAAPAMTKLSPIYSYQDTMASVAMSTQNITVKPGQLVSQDLSTAEPQSIHGVSQVTSWGSAQTESQVPPVQNLSNYEAPSTQQDTCEKASSHLLIFDAPSSQSDRAIKEQNSTLSAGKVRSLPTLSYLQKVDAWTANQSSSRSFYDNIASQGFESAPPKRKMQEFMSDEQIHIQRQHDTQTSQPAVTTSSRPGSGSSRRGDVVGTRVAGASSSASPLAHSQSHSSLSTVVTSIQRDGTQHNPQLPVTSTDDISPGSKSGGGESSLHLGGPTEPNPTDKPERGHVKISALLGLGQFSDMSSNPSFSSALSGSQGSCHGEQSLLASVGAASSVVSLEVDNYAPYWTSRPGSPPHSFELNIEDRIPLYLHNLGIDQSPSTILNPFTRRGPIREPEFSPTDLCTIKGSVGTPTKSTQLSEGGSPQKENFSSSSLLSADSSSSLNRQLAAQKPDRPTSPGSVRMVRCQVDTTHESQALPKQSREPQREGSFGHKVQLSQDSIPPSGAWLDAKESDSSLVGSGTLQEIRRLLGHAESLVSGHSSLASSPGSLCHSESDASYLSLRRNTQTYLDDSTLSSGRKISFVLARSSSDSALKESSSSSCGPLQLSTQTVHIITDIGSKRGEENLKSRDLSVAPRRTEPEGCSAADPDKVGPVSMSVIQMNASSTSDVHQQSQESAENTGVSSPENSPIHSVVEAELDVLSDNSSDSSLAAKVAKLLHSESPVSVVTSRPSTSDPEESKAREWIMMKVSGRQCESIELSSEDRRRIEEIKRELLLHTKHKPQQSSDSEGSTQSSLGGVPESTTGFTAARSAPDRLAEQLQRASQRPLDSTTQLNPFLHHDLEARVHQIALREGLSPIAPLTSITIATSRRTPSPQSVIHRPPTQDDHTSTKPEQEHSHSPTHLTLRSATEDGKQIFVSDREAEVEEKGPMRDDKKRKDEDKQESDNRPVVQSSTGMKDVQPSLDSSEVPSHKPHMSHIHLTLSPKPQQSMTPRLPSPASSPPDSRNTFRGVSSSSKDQHTSAISKTRARNDRDASQVRYTGMSGFSQISSRYPQAFTPPQRLGGPARPLSVHTSAVPTLLPYKPHGSSELFYMPQNNPELSPVPSDTTVESSHPGSDDAVPPRFTNEILGSRELEDSNVTPKHKKGIYCKRDKMNRESTAFGRGRHDSRVAACKQRDSTAYPYQFPTSSTYDMPHREGGAIHHAELEEEEEEFVPLHMEADYSRDDLHYQSHTVRKRNEATEALTLPVKPIREEESAVRTRELGLEISSSLDQLWRRFSERWSQQEIQPTNEGEVSLLERLERLSRLLQSSTPPHTPAKQAHSREERGKIRRREHDLRRPQRKEASRRTDDKDRSEVRVTPKTAWQEPIKTNLEVDEEEQENSYRCPAEKDESASVSVETSSSQSTINTERLVRAFGPHRLNGGPVESHGGQIPKSSDSLLKLYNTINKQKKGHDQGTLKSRHVSVATDIISTDESTASADSLSYSGTYTLPSQRGMSRTLSTKRPKVKLVSKGVQAGDLEIVVNGTRRHTRDVGTIFPTPGSAKDARESSSANPELRASIVQHMTSSTVPVQSQTVLRREGLIKSNQTLYSNGVSWFVSADELKRDARKENEPQPEAVQPASHAWFEPYSRTRPWREPLREPLRERHIQLEREKPPEPKAPTETDSRKPSALVRLSLQEALALHRPEFVSRSRERMKRLCLLAEERKMQTVFNREREELFNRPLPLQQPVAAPPPLPSKRVIPVKEMVQRSKRIYAQLPEVQKRKLEERRKAEYRSYRLNAQLFNKKVTNHVLGRRAPWQ